MIVSILKNVAARRSLSKVGNRYPIFNVDAVSGSEDERMALDREMEKENPREDVVLPLMKTTYSYRRKDMLHNQKSVTLNLETYPALSSKNLSSLCSI